MDGDAPEVVVEHVEVSAPAEPAETDLHVAEHAAHGAEHAGLEERLAAHCASYHATAEEAAQWTEMREIAELESENAELRARLETLEAEQTPAASSSSSSPPEEPEATLSETVSATSSEVTEPPESPPNENQEGPGAPRLETVIQEAPPAETAKSRGKQGKFRRSLGRVAARR